MTERIIGEKGGRRRKRLLILPVLVVVAVALWAVAGAQAVHDEAFQLDGDVIASTTTGIGGTTQTVDWDSLFNADGTTKTLPSGFSDASLDRDFQTSGAGAFLTADTTTFATGSKDTLPISDWQCNFDNNVNSKIDVMNAYAATYKDASGDEFLYFGLERNVNTGDANVGFWFLQSAVGCESTGGAADFTGGHTDGDLLIVSAFSNGGTVSTINVYRWNGDDATGSLGTTPVASGVDCRSESTTVDDLACGAANTAPINTPWLTAAKTTVGHTLPTAQFFEGGLNLTLANLDGKCFSTFLGDTRSSTSLTATLFDYSGGTLGGCGSEVVTTPSVGSDGAVSIGAGSVDVTDNAVLTVTGAAAYDGTMTFSLCGPTPLSDTSYTLCTSGGTQVGAAKTVSGPSPSNIVSDAATITSAGRYCFRADYSGDADVGVPPSSDSSVGECFRVLPVTPSLPTQVSNAGPVIPGTAVSDTATLTGAATPSNDVYGTITFRAYGPDDATCATAVYTSVANVVSGQTVYDSFTDGNGGAFAPTQPGTYRWRAFYAPGAGDVNNLVFDAPCNAANEAFIVEQFQPALTTAQTWTVKDKATITVSGGGDLTGTASFELYDNNTCTGTPLYTQNVAVSGASPQNPETTPYTFTASAPTLYWKVGYTSTNGAHANIAATCTENSSLTIDNG